MFAVRLWKIDKDVFETEREDGASETAYANLDAGFSHSSLPGRHTRPDVG